MGFNLSKKLDRIAFDVPEQLRSEFEKFNLLSIVKGQLPALAFVELIRQALASKDNQALLNRRWVTWDALTVILGEAGYSINRTTLWNYEQKEKYKKIFAELIKRDSVSTVYDADGFLKFFKGE